MYKVVKIGEKEVALLSNAATPIRYNQIFQKDLMKEFNAAMVDKNKIMNFAPEIAFVMAKAAEAKEGKADLNHLNTDIYIEWLEGFEPMDIPMASDEIVTVYTGDAESTVEPKKNEKDKAKEK